MKCTRYKCKSRRHIVWSSTGLTGKQIMAVFLAMCDAGWLGESNFYEVGTFRFKPLVQNLASISRYTLFKPNPVKEFGESTQAIKQRTWIPILNCAPTLIHTKHLSLIHTNCALKIVWICSKWPNDLTDPFILGWKLISSSNCIPPLLPCPMPRYEKHHCTLNNTLLD